MCFAETSIQTNDRIIRSPAGQNPYQTVLLLSCFKPMFSSCSIASLAECLSIALPESWQMWIFEQVDCVVIVD